VEIEDILPEKDFEWTEGEFTININHCAIRSRSLAPVLGHYEEYFID